MGAVPFQAWDKRLFRWEQGEHVTLVGPSGSGKTTLALQLLDLRRYVVVVATKPRDPLISSLKGRRGRGYKVTKHWPVNYRLTPKVVFWPQAKSLGTAQVKVGADIADMLNNIWQSGGWTVYFDELRYVTDNLGLSRELATLWLQGRALNVSVVGGTQRPAWVPLEAYDQATHLFFWRETDRRNLDRVAGLGGVDTKLVRDTVAALRHHEVLYVNTRSGTIIRTLPPKIG